jgi:hypothetical protein
LPDLPARHQVPWITQYATPSLIAAIAYQGHPAADDPRWRESGAPDGAAYGRWCTRLCGMACLRMALIARDGHAPTLFTLLNGCLEAGGYTEHPDGSVTGLLYRQFSDFTRDRYQLQADIITDLDPSRMIRELGQGRLLMASVHKEIRRPDRDPPGTGGHLVLEDVLYGSSTAGPISLSTLDAAATRARHAFQTARYRRLTASLPALIATASATRDYADGQHRATASALLADAYITAANLMVKLNDDPLAWTTADRALLAAQAGDDPLTLADARRAVVTVLRRTSRPARARDLLTSAAQAIEPGRHPDPAQLATYGTLLQVAAYTAAVDGNRQAAAELIGEAAAIAARLGTDTSHRCPTFGLAGVTLYQVSIAQVLGDNGTAIEHARRLRPAMIPTAERQGRYWIDVARAYHRDVDPRRYQARRRSSGPQCAARGRSSVMPQRDWPRLVSQVHSCQ